MRPARSEGDVNDTDPRLWHPWLRINRVLRVMLHAALERGRVVSGPSRAQASAGPRRQFVGTKVGSGEERAAVRFAASGRPVNRVSRVPATPVVGAALWARGPLQN
jgi:hypothetical protein